jgi:hypothetical protein
MRFTHLCVPAAVLMAAGFASLAAQEPRPANVPFYTWVREDTFAGFLNGDMVRFDRAEQKVRDYLAETPGRVDATNWLGAMKVYRAVRAFGEGKAGEGEALLNEAFTLMDEAVTKDPADQGVRATAGGTLVLLARELPPQHHDTAMKKAREHFVVLYKLQAPALPQFPLHLKGELLAGLAETEFKVGDRARATELLTQIVQEMPDTAYAKTAAAWLVAPETVTRDTKIVCQSCHQPGRLSSWMARQRQGAGPGR